MEVTIEQAFQQGVKAHKAGNLQEAERAYQAILQSQPRHPDANHNLGLIAISVDQIEGALSLFKIALDVNPNIEQFWISYVDALVKNNQLNDAKQAIKKAKKKGFDPKKLQALLSQSKCATDTNFPSQSQLNSLLEHYQSGRLNDAEKLATALSQEFPKHHFSWKVLGAIFGQTSRKPEALDAKQTVVALTPQDPSAHYNLGNTLLELGRLHDAETSFIQAITLKPDYVEAHYNLGNTLIELGRLDDAEASFKQVIVLRPDCAEAHSNLGSTLIKLGKLDNAETSFTKAIALKPDYAEAHSNLGSTLIKLGRLDDAEASFNQAIALKPDHAEAHSNLGDVYKEIGKHSKAAQCYEKVLELSSEDSLGVTLKLASLGKRKIPDQTPEKYMKDFYRKKSKKWGGFQNKQSKYRGHLLIEDAFKKTHNPNKQVDILDLGCGTGSLASTLRPYARTLVGVDLSPDMILKAEKNCLYDSLYKKDINHYLAEIINLYDTVIAAAVLIHFFDLENTFFLVKNCLKINGKFIFSIFEGTQKSKDLNSFLMYSHSSEYIAALAQRQNLKIIYMQKDIHEYQNEIPIPSLIYVLEKLS